MACEICGRNNCTRSFHSLEEQEEYDKIAKPIVDGIEGKINKGKKTLEYKAEELGEDNKQYVLLSDALDVLDDLI